MNIKILLLVLICSIAATSCNLPGPFKATVTTDKKPWTNLDFNNDPDNFRFAIVADNNGGSRKGVFEDAVRKINLMQPEFVLSVGDLIEGYTTDSAAINAQWKGINDILSALKMPFFYLPGNHDITNKLMEKEWEKRYGRRYYNFIYKNVQFIILDSNDDDNYNLTQQQTDFALEAIKKHDQVRWTFVLMHHPIWTYDTNGRWPTIASALKGRKFTVIAGHEHHYHQAAYDGSNYYILATTGAGSALRGNYFGEFDHISWITMTKEGPVMANLRLDGILPHDIANDQTKELAVPLINNAKFNNLLLCNRGSMFNNGTLYLSFKNPTKSKLNIEIDFFHHHQLLIKNPKIQLVAEPGSEQLIEVPLVANSSLDYAAIDLLMFDWHLKYDHSDYKDFGLNGKYQLEVKPTKTNFIDRDVDLFTDQAIVGFKNPFKVLETMVNPNNTINEPYLNPITITNTTTLAFTIRNSRSEYSAPEVRTFEKTTYKDPVEGINPQAGLDYQYFEGRFKELPDFSKLEPAAKGITNTFDITTLAKRDDDWGLVLSGYVKIPADNLYLYRLRADDKARLIVDNQVIANDKPLKNNETSGAVALKKGYHTIRIEFIEISGDARLRLYSKAQGDEDWKQDDFSQMFH